MMLISLRIKHPESKKTVNAIFDADTGITYVSNGSTTIVMAPGGISFEADHDIEEMAKLLADEIAEG